MRFFLLAVLIFAGCAREKPLQFYGDVPAFELISQQGRKFDRASLNGHVWVADFVFTNCQGPCPRMSSHMRELQNKTDAQVKLVSFTVDPDNDTPPVLAAYAQRFGADAARWSFLTGDKATLNTLDQDAFKLGTIGAGMDHSTRFVLVDKKGRIRGYYGIAEGDPIAKISKDAARLEKRAGVNYVHYLPTLNAILNGTAAVLLAWGFLLIRRRRIQQHRRVMLTAFGVSCAFLVSYLAYHAQVGSVKFQHTGTLRTLYLSILLTHTVLAATVPVLAVITLNRALNARFDRHRAIARWTLPIWLYVSVTGVVVYLMLYHL